jgi:hypothetical protein
LPSFGGLIKKPDSPVKAGEVGGRTKGIYKVMSSVLLYTDEKVGTPGLLIARP